jgi:hypothetical protein
MLKAAFREEIRQLMEEAVVTIRIPAAALPNAPVASPLVSKPPSPVPRKGLDAPDSGLR